MADYRVPIAGETDLVFNARTSGIAASIQYEISDNEGNTIVGPTNSGVGEIGTTGVYKVPNFQVPGTVGYWTIVWSKDGSFDPNTNAVDLLQTYDPGTEAPDVPPLTPISDDGSGLAVGPCSAWTTSEDAAACCGTDSDTSLLDGPVVAASQVLYELSNHLFSGTCERRVRPCGLSCGGPWQRWQGWGWLPMSRAPAADFGVFGTWGEKGASAFAGGCGCQPQSRIPLAGAAREILEVTIDGQLVAPASYRLDERRWLTRVDGEAWPGCQDMDAAETEDGTFSILYTYGQDPPVIGQYAAQELACAIAATCPGGGEIDTECVLPAGVTKVERQGITLDTEAFRDFAWTSSKGWATGLGNVDMFLNTYAPNGRQRRTRVWSPDTRRFPRPVAGAS